MNVILTPVWLLRLSYGLTARLQLPKPGELTPVAEGVFLTAVFLGGLVWTIWYASKKGLRMFATGVSTSVFDAAVKAGNDEHARMQRQIEAIEERVIKNEKDCAVKADRLDRAERDIQDLFKRRGR